MRVLLLDILRIAFSCRNGLHLLLNAVPHVENVAEYDAFVNLQICVEVIEGKFSMICPKLPTVALLRVDLVKLLCQGACMHHTLVFEAIFCVGSDIDHDRIMLRQRRLEISLLPFELFEFIGCKVRRTFIGVQGIHFRV